MYRLVEFIKTNDGLNETEAKAKLNLIYIKMNQSEIKEFVDEFTEWLMTEKKMNYKAILLTPDHELHERQSVPPAHVRVIGNGGRNRRTH